MNARFEAQVTGARRLRAQSTVQANNLDLCGLLYASHNEVKCSARARWAGRSWSAARGRHVSDQCAASRPLPGGKDRCHDALLLRLKM